MTVYQAANAARLESILSPEYGDQAKPMAFLIRNIWKAQNLAEIDRLVPELFHQYQKYRYHVSIRHAKQWIIDSILCSHGVEYLGRSRSSGNEIHYCNAGDPYTGTIIFSGSVLYVGCWGDLVERDSVAPIRNF